MDKIINALTLSDKEVEYVTMGIVLGVGLGIFMGLFFTNVEFTFAIGAVLGIIGSLIFIGIKRIKRKNIMHNY